MKDKWKLRVMAGSPEAGRVAPRRAPGQPLAVLPMTDLMAMMMAGRTAGLEDHLAEKLSPSP
jgi:hypothetical protein